MVRTRAAISAGVSPLARRATANPAIWAGVARPSRIVARAPPASSGARSSPRISLAGGAGQIGASASVGIGRERTVAPGGIPVGELRAAPTLAQYPAAFAFGQAAPDAVLLAGGEGELEAGLADGAHAADHLGLFGQGVVFRGRIEHQRVAPPAEAGGAPILGHGPAHLLRPVRPLHHHA